MTRYAKRKLKYSHNENLIGAYPYMDLNAKYEKRYYDVLLRLIQIRISPKRGKLKYSHNENLICSHTLNGTDS
jgi:hypothetical protein